MAKVMLYCWIMPLLTLATQSDKALLENSSCPSPCECAGWSVKCIGKGLQEIPTGIPSIARQIDLSKNPLSHLESEYFLQFKDLHILILNNCSLRGPIYLPSTVRDVNLENNFFTMEALQKMFSNKTKLLRHINLSNNQLRSSEVREILKLLPSAINDINLSGNLITRLTKNEIGRLKNLKRINLKRANIGVIDANAFDNLTQLFAIWLDENELRFLPDNLFRCNTHLSKLHLGINKLTGFNATKLGLNSLVTLDLRHNRLSTFDLQKITVNNLWLSNNNIERLDHQIFANKINLKVFALYGNNISYISANAFNNIDSIYELSMQQNALRSLPKDLFTGMLIRKIILRENILSSFTGVFDGIKPHLRRLDLAENDELRNINGTDLAALPAFTVIYVNCTNLKQLNELSQLKAKLVCSPTDDLTIDTPSGDGLQCKGFICTYNGKIDLFTCKACRKGYYSSCNNKKSCIPCPPGSFFQDQPGSKSCESCQPGQFVPPEKRPGKDASDCQTCPEGTNRTTLAYTRACKCLQGYSRRYRFGPCNQCKDKGFDCSHDYQTLRNGFWMTWKGPTLGYASGNLTRKYYEKNRDICQQMYKAFVINLDIADDTYDKSTMHFNCQMPLSTQCPVYSSCLGGTQPKCSFGYNGALCAVCSKGFSKQFSRCVRCPHRALEALNFIGYSALFIILCWTISILDSISIEQYQNFTGKDKKHDYRSFADIILSCLKIQIGFYQVLISIVHEFSNIHWAENFKKATTFFEYIQFQIIKLPSLRCIMPEWNIDAVAEFWITCIITISLPVSVLLYYFLKSLYIHYQCLSPPKAKAKRNSCARNCTKVVALFLFLTYPLISEKIIQILPISCHSFCTAKHSHICIHSMSYLRSDYSIACPTLADRKGTLITSYICLIFPLGLPIAMFMLLRSYAPKIRPPTLQPATTSVEDNEKGGNDHLHYIRMASINDVADNKSDDPNVQIMTHALKFLYENYHFHCWYWEVIEMTRKLFMTIGVVLFLRHTKTGLACTIIVAMGFALLHAIIQPVRSKFESAAQSLSLVLIPLNLAFAAVLQSGDTETPSIINKEMDLHYAGLFLIVANSSLVFVVIGRIIVMIARKVRYRTMKLQ